MWFKVDDKLHSHKKAAKAGDALALWVVAGSWCSDHLTDGFVPDYMVGRLMPGGDDMAQRLADAGLWAPGECDGETGWQFHGWDEYQPTRDDVESQRERERDKKRKQRRTPKGQFEASPEPSPGDTAGTPKGTPEGVTPSRPDPTRTQDQNTRDIEPPEPETPAPQAARFESWWLSFPRRNGKRLGKQTARRAFAKIRDLDALDEATAAYAAAVERGETIAKDPHRFLSADYWRDWLPDPPGQESMTAAEAATAPPATTAREPCDTCGGTGWQLGDGNEATPCDECNDQRGRAA